MYVCVTKPVRTTVTLHPIGRPVRATITLYPIGTVRATTIWLLIFVEFMGFLIHI